MKFIAFIFLGLGVFFALLGNLGVLRFPDVYTRLQAASKCSTTSLFSLFIGLVLLEGVSSFSLRIGVIGLFFFVTGPVASHLIGRSAWEGGVLPWRRVKKVPPKKKKC